MNESNDQQLARYSRQIRFARLGEQGQRQLMSAKALICGCGALGSVSADLLVRAGVGTVRVVDRDFLEADNLHRQVLFDEADVAESLPKAAAAARRLKHVNSTVVLEPIVADVTADNVAALADDVDVILDGTDNFETRYLLNDFSVSSGTPWVFGGCVGAEGQMMAILPGETPCLRCLMPEPPPAESQPTCETAGVVGPIVNVISSLQSMEAIKILSGNRDAVSRRMTIADLWSGELRTVGVEQVRGEHGCSTCGDRKFDWLSRNRGSTAVALCGRNSVQITPGTESTVSLSTLREKLEQLGHVLANEFLLRAEVDGYQLTVFADGRTIVGGTDDPDQARAIHARFIGG